MSPATFIKETRTVGLRKAFKHFNERRHLLPLIGYLVLALATMWAFKVADDTRDRLADQQRIVLIEGCERTNTLRASIVLIVQNTTAGSKKALERNLITQEQYDRGLAFVELAEKQLGPIDCEAAYPPLKG